MGLEGHCTDWGIKSYLHNFKVGGMDLRSMESQRRLLVVSLRIDNHLCSLVTNTQTQLFCFLLGLIHNPGSVLMCHLSNRLNVQTGAYDRDTELRQKNSHS